ncbi:DUF3501 family protein [Hydrogenophaga sp. 5NK40-0174]|uniref:DUF3501 family protein n=1 Tax=Hydrogenophaga sp. 5NK40-0174 TaxID=3127649 RepID=UPI00310B93DB
MTDRDGLAAQAAAMGMELHGGIAPDNLMTLEAYDRWRREHKPAMMAHRRLRSLDLGDHLTLQFESELTMRYQVQEMLRVERIFTAEGIADEVAAYAPLVPTGTNWKATLLLGFSSPEERRAALSRLVGVEHRLFVEVAGQDKVFAVADEDLDRSTASKTSAVHYLRFELPQGFRDAVLGGASVTLGCDLEACAETLNVPAATLESLRLDLVS